MRRILRFGRRQEGAAVVEFALCLIPLLLILGGIIDFGQAWYMQSVLTTASREGARYATRYYDPSNSGKTVPAANREVSQYLADKYAGLLPNDAHFTVTLEGATGSTNSGDQVGVGVQAVKHWFILGNLLPGFSENQTLKSTTWMALE
jgi:Flp pilus assembly protein TadG